MINHTHEAEDVVDQVIRITPEEEKVTRIEVEEDEIAQLSLEEE